MFSAADFFLPDVGDSGLLRVYDSVLMRSSVSSGFAFWASSLVGGDLASTIGSAFGKGDSTLDFESFGFSSVFSSEVITGVGLYA